ncbi:MAG: hypothetical protein H0W99_05535 [Acidobacteria bacterium]|nr:hypothetical protein [Acidobacteriota bacterium]
MRRLIIRPLVLTLTFLTGLFITFIFTSAGDGFLARPFDEPSENIPALCLSDCSESSACCPQTPAQEAEEAAVYSALVEQMSTIDRANLLVVQDRTVNAYSFPHAALEDDPVDRLFEALQLDFPFAEQETITSFRTNNEQSWPITKPFLFRTKSRLISQQEIERFSPSKPGIWWEAFYRDYRGAAGFLMLSKVGFNREMNQALVYRAFACGDTCGFGSYVFLVKKGGVWRIKSVSEPWVS